MIWFWVHVSEPAPSLHPHLAVITWDQNSVVSAATGTVWKSVTEHWDLVVGTSSGASLSRGRGGFLCQQQLQGDLQSRVPVYGIPRFRMMTLGPASHDWTPVIYFLQADVQAGGVLWHYATCETWAGHLSWTRVLLNILWSNAVQLTEWASCFHSCSESQTLTYNKTPGDLAKRHVLGQAWGGALEFSF